MFNENVYKIVLSKPKTRQNEYKRIDIIKNEKLYQASLFGEKKVTHINMDINETKNFVNKYFQSDFLQYNAWDEHFEYESKKSKKGKTTTSKKISANPPKKPDFCGSSFNRQKNHIINEGDEVSALVELGVFSKDFKILSGKRDKFVQINRFLEIINDETKKLTKNAKINLIDFGCGKSYLTFLLNHYFIQICGFDVNICGLDSDYEVIRKCRETTQRNNYQNITFTVCDISKLSSSPMEEFGNKNYFNIAVCLHACDTATDYALANAIKWGADLICASPCCQHELSSQFLPKNLTIFADYGIIRERISQLATDLIRAKVLEACGYSVQIIEFTSFRYTEKNLLIRARKTGRSNKTAHKDIEKLCDEFGFSPSLLNIVR